MPLKLFLRTVKTLVIYGEAILNSLILERKSLGIPTRPPIKITDQYFTEGLHRVNCQMRNDTFLTDGWET